MAEAYDTLFEGIAFRRGKFSKSLAVKRDDASALSNPTKRRKIASLNLGPTQSSNLDSDEPVANEPMERASSESVLTDEAEISAYRRRNRIHVFSHSVDWKDTSSKPTKSRPPSGNVPPPIRSFDELANPRFGVSDWVIRNVKLNFKFETPSPIQQQAIPCILTGEPLLASAPTGSGKTLAFLLPLICLLHKPGKGLLRALVIVPSRELAVQTVREFEVLRGAKKFRCRLLDAVQADTKRLDMGVSTALKLIQLLQENKVHLNDLRHMVLDEADKLLDMGFAPQLDEILSFIPTLAKVQFLLFSATLPPSLLRLTETLIASATRISIGTPMTANADIDQRLVFVTKDEGKLVAFRQMIGDGLIEPPALVFTHSVERAQALFRELLFDGLFVDVMHADRSKKERDAVVQGFREKKIWFLLCTDLMARGVDFKGVKTVINWDMPADDVTYIHRVGRTGRAGMQGVAITFYTIEDMTLLPKIVSVLKRAGISIPEWMAKMKKPSKKDFRQLRTDQTKRYKTISYLQRLSRA